MGKVIDFPMSSYKLTPEEEQALTVMSELYPNDEDIDVDEFTVIRTEFFDAIKNRALNYDEIETKYINLLEEHKKLLEQCVENK